MGELQDEREVIKLERDLRREGREDFIEQMRNAGVELLDSKLLGLAKHREAINDTQQNDEELRTAKAVASNLGAPYREQLTMNKKLTRFITLLRKEQGLE